MSLDLYIVGEAGTTPCICSCGHQHMRESEGELFHTNITHNLSVMFDEAGVYQILWHGDGSVAGDVLPELERGLALMRAESARFRRFNAPNGWGTYEQAVLWLEKVIEACRANPKGKLRCNR